MTCQDLKKSMSSVLDVARPFWINPDVFDISSASIILTISISWTFWCKKYVFGKLFVESFLLDPFTFQLFRCSFFVLYVLSCICCLII